MDETGRLLFPRILVATDFSANSHRALLHACSVARRYGSKIYLAHVIPPVPKAHGDTSDQQTAEQQMQDSLRTIPGCADSCGAIIEKGEGPLWVTIERLIHKYKINLIVAGTRGLGARSEPTLGSGAEQIFRHATCPVLTIGPATGAGDLLKIEFKSILYVTDFGPSAERALSYAISNAHKFEARLRFLQAAQDAAVCDEHARNHFRQIHIQRMKHSLAASHAAVVLADFFVRFGNTVDEILAAERELPADLLVMGAKATAAWAGNVPLSTAYNVAAKASCPVLTVRA